MRNDFNLTDHLEELRKRLLISGLSVVLLGVISFLFSDAIMDWMIAPILDRITSLYFFSPFEAFLAKIKISVVSGILLASPVIFTQLWQFVSPGLYPREQKLTLILIGASTLLFLLGVLIAYFMVVPMALKFFLDFRSSSLVPLISLDSYLTFFVSVLVAFGVMFDLPVVLVGFIWLGVLETPFLASQRKVVIVLIFIAAAILTPTADIVTQILFAIPLAALFEGSLLVGRLIERKREPQAVSK